MMSSGRALKVAIIEEAPFWTLEDGQYTGFLGDLLEELARAVGITYDLVPSVDGKYGAPDSNGNWNGMVGMVVNREVDLAVAPLTITYLREQVVDFTKPYMSLGISMLTKVTGDSSAGCLLLRPFQGMVWGMLALALLLVALFLFLLNRHHPGEHRSRYLAGLGSKKDAELYSCHGSLWVAVTSLQLQGRNKAPRSMAGRLLLIFWFAFTIFTLVSYTASMINILASDKRRGQLGVSNVKELLQSDFNYGYIGGGSTMTFFKNSKVPTYHLIYPDGIQLRNTAEAMKKVNEGDFVFFGESSMLDYQMKNSDSCDLVRFGGLLDSKGYGIATRRGSPYRDLLSDAILRLREDGTLQLLTRKWFADDRCEGKRPIIVGSDSDSVSEGLSLQKFSSALILLALGCVLSFTVAVIEVIIANRKKAGSEGKADAEAK